MLHSGHPEAKSLIDNGLRVRKAHCVVGGSNAISTILWAKQAEQIKQVLNSKKIEVGF